MASSPTYAVVVNGTDISDRAYDLNVGPRRHSADVAECKVLTKGLGDLVRTGDRHMVVYRNGLCVHNGIIWDLNASGDKTQGWVQIRSMGALIRLQTRWVQDAGGQIFDGVSADGTDRGLDLPAGGLLNPALPVTGGELLRQCVENTIANDGACDLTTAGGDFSGTLNVRFALRNITPMKVGDLLTKLAGMNAISAWVTPTPGLSILNAAQNPGGASGAHFQYGTGSFNCEAGGYTESMDEFCNKLWQELGAREGSHFKNNITATAPGVTTDDSGSRSQYGVYHDIQMLDDFSGNVKNSDPLYAGFVRNYNAQLAFRMRPKQIVWVTPQAGAGPEPWTGFGLGSTALVSIGELGQTFSGVGVRIWGWNAQPQNDKPEKVTLFLERDSE